MDGKTLSEQELEKREARREYAREWRRKNPDRVRLHQQRYRDRHLQEVREYRRKWRAANKDKVSEYNKRYHAKKVAEYEEMHRQNQLRAGE